MYQNLKIILAISFLIGWEFAHTQSIVQSLRMDRRTQADKEMILEIGEAFKIVKDSLKIDFDRSDTLFMIYGIDIQSREGSGFIWDRTIITRYSDKKIFKNHQLASSNPSIEIISNKIDLNEFDDLIPIIERWDTLHVKNYVDSCNEVLSGLFWWSIYRFIKTDKKYNVDLLVVRNFGLKKKNNN